MGWFFWARPELVVLAADAGEIPAMAEIHELSFPHGWGEDEMAAMLRSPGMTAWVAKPAGKGDAPALAFVMMRQAADEAEIITLATSPQLRRAGAGRALMLSAIRHCRQEGVRRLLLEVSEMNAAAIALYRSLGFRQIGKRKGYYVSAAQRDAEPPSALVMALELR